MNIGALDRAMELVRRGLAQDEEILRAAESDYGSLKGVFNSDAVGFCLGRLIDAELDSHTAGDRGLGRVSAHVPRIGAYFRSGISRLTEPDRRRLRDAIQDLMLSGYLAFPLFMEEGNVKSGKIKDSSKLFETWLPGVYADAITLGEKLTNIVCVCAEAAWENVKADLRDHRMRGGGLFSKDKTDQILWYYAYAGFCLRVVEVQGGYRG